MLGAFVTSTLFLASYLIYHFQVLPGSVRFAGTGWSRSVYYAILLTHVVLAAVILPLALVTLSRALKERFDKHRQIARWDAAVVAVCFRDRCGDLLDAVSVVAEIVSPLAKRIKGR
jgi:uncharacterized membrane protein YozB (DUF420 family)